MSKRRNLKLEYNYENIPPVDLIKIIADFEVALKGLDEKASLVNLQVTPIE